MTGQEIVDILLSMPPEYRELHAVIGPRAEPGKHVAAIWLEGTWSKACPCSDCETPEECAKEPPVILIS